MTRRLLASIVFLVSLAIAAPLTAPAIAAPSSAPLVLVGGATGRTGQLIAQQLLKEGFRVRGMTRDAKAAARDYGTRIEWVEADIRDPASLQPAFAGVQSFINAIGTESFGGDNGPEQVNYEGMKHLVDAAAAHGVKYFGLVSAGGVEDAKAYIARGLRDGATWRYRGEEYLRDSELDYTIVRAGGLRDFPGGENGILILQKDDIAPGLITRADVAAVMVECVDNPDCRNKTFAIVNYLAIDAEGWRQRLAKLATD